jgi:hypothetical protein
MQYDSRVLRMHGMLKQGCQLWASAAQNRAVALVTEVVARCSAVLSSLLSSSVVSSEADALPSYVLSCMCSDQHLEGP